MPVKPLPSKARIKFIRSLQSRKVRDELGLFLAEGPRVVEELLDEPRVQVQDVFATEHWATGREEMISRAGGALTPVSDSDLARLSALSTPNNVLAVFTKPRFEEEAVLRGRLTVVLDAVQDPGNVGTIIRSADWFGVKTVVCGHGCADPFNSKVIQSTMGSIARVQVLCVADWDGFEALLGDVPVVAATLDGDPADNLALPEGAVLVIGNEARGVSPRLLDQARYRVTIPRRGQAESLNAAVAASILMSQLAPKLAG